jgi:hypothetical protein
MARSMGKAPPRLGLPAGHQGRYGGSPQWRGDGEAVKAAGAAVVLQRRWTPVVFDGDGDILEHWGMERSEVAATNQGKVECG